MSIVCLVDSIKVSKQLCEQSNEGAIPVVYTKKDFDENVGKIEAYNKVLRIIDELELEEKEEVEIKSRVLKEVLSVYNIEDLLEEMETQLDVLAEEYEKAELPASAKDYRDSAREICRLRIIDKFLNGSIAEYQGYVDHKFNEFSAGVIAGFRKTLLHLHGK